MPFPLKIAVQKLMETVKKEWLLISGWAVMFGAYSAFSLFRHWHFQSNACDLGIFDQAIWHYSRFEKPACTISGYDNLLGDHFHPTLMLLAPFYWLVPKAEVLLVAQALFLTIPMFPLFFFAEKRIGRIPAYFLTLSYSLLGGLQSTAAFDFHEICLAVPFIAFAIYFMDLKRWGFFYAAIFLLMMTKENMCLLAAFFGLLLIIRGESKRGSFLACVGFFTLLFEIKILIPFFGGPNRPYQHWSYAQLGPDPLSALKTCLLHPIHVLGLFFSDGDKINTIRGLFKPFLFSPLCSSWSLLTLPNLFERLLSSEQYFWIPNHQHYSATLCPIVAFAAADGLSKIFKHFASPNRRKWIMTAFSALILLANIAVLSNPQRSKFSIFLQGSYFSIAESDRTGMRALALIPPGASVLAQSSIAPHLTHRPVIHYIGRGALEGPVSAEYIITCDHLDTWPVHGFQSIQEYLNRSEKKECRKIFDEKGWTVLEKIPTAEKHPADRIDHSRASSKKALRSPPIRA